MCQRHAAHTHSHSVKQSLMLNLSLSHRLAHAHTQTPFHLPNPSFPRLISSLLSSKNDSCRYFHSLHRKKEQIYLVESQNWVQIILLCQGSLDFFLPDLTFGVYPQDTNFLPFYTVLTHFVMYFRCTHGLLDIVLQAGCFL